MVNQYFRVFWSWYVDTLNIHIWTFKEGSKLNVFWGSLAELRLEVSWMLKDECLLHVFWMFTCRLGNYLLKLALPKRKRTWIYNWNKMKENTFIKNLLNSACPWSRAQLTINKNTFIYLIYFLFKQLFSVDIYNS